MKALIGFLAAALWWSAAVAAPATPPVPPARVYYQVLIDGRTVGRTILSRESVPGGVRFTQTDELTLFLDNRPTRIRTVLACRTTAGLKVLDFNFSFRANGREVQRMRGLVRGDQLRVDYVFDRRTVNRGRREFRIKGRLIMSPMVLAWIAARAAAKDRAVAAVIYEPHLFLLSRVTGGIKPLPGPGPRAEVTLTRRGGVYRYLMAADGYATRIEAPLRQTLVRRPGVYVPTTVSRFDVRSRLAVPVTGKLPPPGVSPRVLRLRLSGKGWRRLPLNGPRQRLNGDVLTITREDPATIKTYRLPARVEARYLQATAYLQADDPRIKAAARRILANETDAKRAVAVLTSWVYVNLAKNSVAHAPDAVSVLRVRDGDCKAHAVLFVALARAAGIPARVSVGLVMTGGKFYYHDWASVWLGRWVAVDPVFNRFPAGAGYLRLQWGVSAGVAEIEGVVGNLALEVLDWQS